MIVNRPIEDITIANSQIQAMNGRHFKKIGIIGDGNCLFTSAAAGILDHINELPEVNDHLKEEFMNAIQETKNSWSQYHAHFIDDFDPNGYQKKALNEIINYFNDKSKPTFDDFINFIKNHQTPDYLTAISVVFGFGLRIIGYNAYINSMGPENRELMENDHKHRRNPYVNGISGQAFHAAKALGFNMFIKGHQEDREADEEFMSLDNAPTIHVVHTPGHFELLIPKERENTGVLHALSPKPVQPKEIISNNKTVTTKKTAQFEIEDISDQMQHNNNNNISRLSQHNKPSHIQPSQKKAGPIDSNNGNKNIDQLDPVKAAEESEKEVRKAVQRYNITKESLAKFGLLSIQQNLFLKGTKIKIDENSATAVSLQNQILLDFIEKNKSQFTNKK